LFCMVHSFLLHSLNLTRQNFARVVAVVATMVGFICLPAP
jgi:hypothetical protein